MKKLVTIIFFEFFYCLRQVAPGYFIYHYFSFITISRSAVFHTKTRVCLKYFLHDCSYIICLKTVLKKNHTSVRGDPTLFRKLKEKHV